MRPFQSKEGNAKAMRGTMTRRYGIDRLEGLSIVTWSDRTSRSDKTLLPLKVNTKGDSWCGSKGS